nr:AI-2E family transporter [Halarchaeum solikamskense]
MLALIASLALVVLAGVLGTVVFATTVAYLLAPVYYRIEDRGLDPWWAAATTAVGAAVVSLVPATAFVYLLYVRSSGVLAFIRALPDSFGLSIAGVVYTIDVSTLTATVEGVLRDITLSVLGSLPVLGIKFTLFGVLVFGLLVAHEDAESAVLAAVPLRYHDVVAALSDRARETLYAIYVLQAATAAVTAAIAVPVFWLLGFTYPVTLALVCGVLQFLPVVGPSLVVLGLALYRLSVGDVTGAIAVLVVAGTLVAWLPDPLVRPRLSRHTARIPGSLYFVGFTGGLLTVGALGVIVGPLAVALLVETVSLLADEEGKHRG